jgi:GGDEF domain-containing protein
MNITEIRKKYPQYNDLSNEALAKGLHKRHYSDMSFKDFSAKIGHKLPEPEPSTWDKTKKAVVDFINPPPPEPKSDISGKKPYTPKGKTLLKQGIPEDIKGIEPYLKTAEDVVYHLPETAAQLGSNFVSLPASGVAGLGRFMSGIGNPSNTESMDDRLKAASELAGKVYNKLTYHPATERGQRITENVTYPLKKLHEASQGAGDWVHKKTGSPTLGAITASGIEALPLAIPFLRGKGKAAFNKIKNSDLYRKATIKERGVVVQSLEETLKKNPNMTEAELVKKSDQYFKEALEKRRQGETLKPNEEPIKAHRDVTPEADLPYHEQPNFKMAGEHNRYSPEFAETLKAQKDSTALPPGQGFAIVKPKPEAKIFKPKGEQLTAEEAAQTFDEAGIMPKEPGRLAEDSAQVFEDAGLIKKQTAGTEAIPETPSGYASIRENTSADRRVDLISRKSVDEMTAEEMAQALLTNEVTGLPNKRAFDEQYRTEPTTHVARVDMDNLHKINEIMTYKGGDKLIKKIAEVAEAEGISLFHEKGDEFLAKGSDKELQSKLDRLTKQLESATVTYTIPDGKTYRKEGIGISYGIGRNLSEAEAGQLRSKEIRTEKGYRVERDDPTPGLVEIPATGRDIVNRNTGIGRNTTREVTPEVPQEIPASDLRKTTPEEQPIPPKTFSERLKEAPDGPVDPRLIAKKELLENKLKTNESIGNMADKTDMPGTYVTGSSGVSRSRIKKINRQLDRRIDRAVENVKAREDLAWVNAKIQSQKDVHKKGIINDEVVSRLDKQFASIKVGDFIDIGGNHPLRVIKKNKKTVVTDQGVKWTANEIGKVIKKESPGGIKQEDSKPSYKKSLKDQLKDQSGFIEVEIPSLRAAVKKFKINLPDKDMTVLEKWTGLPTWIADKYPDVYKPIQEVIDNRFRHKNIIRNGFTRELVDSWSGLDKKSINKVGKILWRGDELEKVLSGKGLTKLTPEEKRAYKSTREVLDYIWYEDRVNLMEELGVDQTEIDQFRQEAGKIKGYMPHPREGRYFARVKNRKGEIIWREHFEDIVATITRKKFGGRAVLKKAELEKKFDDAFIEIGENTPTLAEEAYFEVSPQASQELINAAMEHVSDSKSKAEFKNAMNKAVAEVFKVRGFMSHAIERKKIPGYDKSNWQDSILNYVSQWAGFKSKMIASREMWDTWGKIDWKGREKLRAFASKQIRDTFENATRLDRTIDKARAVLFRQFLSGMVKSAAIQTTQNYLTTIPRLTVETNFSGLKVQSEMNKAALDVVKAIYTKPKKGWTRRQTAQAKRLSPEEQRGLTRARENGIISAQTTDELMGQTLGKYGTLFNKVDRGLAFMFQSAETFNRETAYLAAFRIAKKKGKSYEDAAQFAEDIIDQTHFRYGKTNLPAFARGNLKAGRAAYSFRHYMRNLFHLWGALGKRHGVKGKWGLAKSFAALMVFGGAMSFPFIETIDEQYTKLVGKGLISDIAKKTGKWSKYMLYGVPGALGIDLTGSLGTDIPTSVMEVLGAPTEWFKRIKHMYQDIKQGDTQRAIEDFPLMPNFTRSPMASYRYATRGIESRTGKKKTDEDFEPVKLTTGEAIKKSIGFQPTKVSEFYRKERATGLVRKTWQNRKKTLLAKLRKAGDKYGLDSSQFNKVLDEIIEYNEKVPVLVAPITNDAINNALTPDYQTKREAAYGDQ